MTPLQNFKYRVALAFRLFPAWDRFYHSSVSFGKPNLSFRCSFGLRAFSRRWLAFARAPLPSGVHHVEQDCWLCGEMIADAFNALAISPDVMTVWLRSPIIKFHAVTIKPTWDAITTAHPPRFY